MKDKRVRRKVTLGEAMRKSEDEQRRLPAPVMKGRVAFIPLLTILSQRDREVEARREGLDAIHVTAALSGDFCGRREWIIRNYNTNVGTNTPFSSQRIVWALGRAAERHVRDSLLASMRGNAVGVWSCVCGKESHIGKFVTDRKCTACDTLLEIYGEHRAVSPSGNVSGSIDFLYQDEEEDYGVLEIKSIQKADYEKLTGPLTSHRDQCNFYVHLLRLRGLKVGRASVLYVAKDAVSGSPYKVYEIPMEIQPSVIQAHKDAEEAFQEELPAKRSGCASPSSPIARKCSQCAMCFSLE